MCRCHDHMFDAISTKDYAIAGYLQSSRRQEAFLDPHNKIQTALNEIVELREKIEKNQSINLKKTSLPNHC